MAEGRFGRRARPIVVLVGFASAMALATTQIAGAAGEYAEAFPDPTGDGGTAPDITLVALQTASNSDHTTYMDISFANGRAIDLPSDARILTYLDTDRNPATGDPAGAEFLIVLFPSALRYAVFRWNGSAYAQVHLASMHANIADAASWWINPIDLENTTGFNFYVEAVQGDGSPGHYDRAPDSGTWPWPILEAPPPAPPPPQPPVATPSPPPSPPATRLSAMVGPGATISLKAASGAPARSLKAGPYTITVHDLSNKDDFHLEGPGVNRKTSTPGKGTTVWRLKLGAGVYRYHSDAHPGLKGTFTVKPAPPSQPSAPAANPSLKASAQAGHCPECFYYVLEGSGFHPNSSVSLVFEYSTPCCPSFPRDDTYRANQDGAWRGMDYFETCEFDGTYSGPIVVTIRAIDAEGAKASARVSGGAASCP